MRAPRVIVTDAARTSAVSIIRSLGRCGAHVIAASSVKRSSGFYSRYAMERLEYPEPERHPEEVVDVLHRTALERDVDLIIPVTDDVVVPLSGARERFEGVCDLAIADPDALAVTRDKEATLALARRLGVPAPRTVRVTTTDEARREAATLGWPVVLKPQASRVYGLDNASLEALSVSYAGGFARLEERMRQFEGLCPVLVQEYTRGEAYGVELLAHRGRPLVAFQHHRLREVPITGGASSYRESVPIDPVLYDYSIRLLEALEWTGLAMVEFKVGEDGPRLMEINGRVWGSLPLAVRSGVDFPARLLDLHLNGVNGTGDAAQTPYELGVRLRNLDLDIVWMGSVLLGERKYPFLEVPPRRAALRVAAELVARPRGFDMGDRADPKPMLIQLLNIAEKVTRKARVAR